MKPLDEFMVSKRKTLGRAIRSGDVDSVYSLLKKGVTLGRNQFELAARKTLHKEGVPPNSLRIAARVLDEIRHDRESYDRASRYIECTLITIGKQLDIDSEAARKALMELAGIVPGEAALTHYGKYNKDNWHLAMRPG